MSAQVTRRRPFDENGNLIVVMGVIMILVFLSAAVVARTIAGQHASRQGQDFSGALANADAGVSDALFRIDQLGAVKAASFCVGNSASCTVASVPGAPSVQYTARRVDDNTYEVLSKGLVNGQPHAVEAIVSRTYSYPYAIFAKTSLTFNGNTGNYDPTTGIGPVETVDANGNPVLTPAPDVATNGQVTCHGSPSPAHQQDYYKGGGTNCANGYLQAGNYNPLDPLRGPCPPPPPENNPPTPCVPVGVLACPATGGVLPPTLQSGAYLCTQNDAVGGTISFPSNFTYGGGSNNGGVIELYLISTDGSNMNISIANDTVNSGGDPTQLKVYMAGAGSILEGNGAHAGDFTGIMYAPSANATINACNANWRGAVIVNTWTCNGGPHLSIQYDDRIQTIVSDAWQVTDYTEIPSGEVTLP